MLIYIFKEKCVLIFTPVSFLSCKILEETHIMISGMTDYRNVPAQKLFVTVLVKIPNVTY